MTGKVPALSMIFMAVSGVISFGLPILLLVWLKVRKKADMAAFFIGCLIMLVFAFILESSVCRVVLTSPAGERILSNTVLYAVYGGLMAGFFEETGRLFAFKAFFGNKRNKNVNAIMYGAGHGGFEAIVLLGLTSINNLTWSILINSGNTKAITGSLTGDALSQAQAAISSLTTTAPLLFLMGGLERIFAIVLHIALSLLVWTAVKRPGRFYLFPAAILIHAMVDGVTVIFSNAGMPVPVLEAVIGLMSLLTLIYAKKEWKQLG